VLAGLLIRRGSVPEAKLRMAKRLSRARAVIILIVIYFKKEFIKAFKNKESY
jgi:hypothetical protein